MSNQQANIVNDELEVKTYICTAIPFKLGAILITRGIQSLLQQNSDVSLIPYLMRHEACDWGNVCIEDKISNDEATKKDQRILSSYTFCGEKILVITEWNRIVTTFLFPSEY